MRLAYFCSATAGRWFNVHNSRVVQAQWSSAYKVPVMRRPGWGSVALWIDRPHGRVGSRCCGQ